MNSLQSDEEDLTRKQRREQARAQRKELEEAEAARAVRRTRLTQLAIVGSVVIVAIVGILIATGGGGGTKKVAAHSKEATEKTTVVSALLGGIPQSGGTLGRATAPVTLQYFGDLECPICKDFTLGALPSIIKQWVSAGKLKIEYRSMETATHEPETFRTQQIAALAAGKQNRMWQFIELFYHEQGEENSGYVTESYIQNLAQQIPGLDLGKWTAARSDATLANQVTSDGQAANVQGFTGTPSFLLGKSAGTQQKFEPPSFTDPTSFNLAIEKLLKA
jgi:protein-disulfide isomerase